MRKSDISRKTAETDIRLTLTLDGTGKSDIQTGVEAMLASGALAQGDASAVAVAGAQKVDTTTVDVVLV